MRQAAAHGAAVSGLNVPDALQGHAKQGNALGERVVTLDRDLARARADARLLWFDGEVLERVDLVDVDEHGWTNQSHRHHGHETLPASDDLRVRAVSREQRAGFL